MNDFLYFAIECKKNGKWCYWCGIETLCLEQALDRAAEMVQEYHPHLEPADWRIIPATKELIDAADEMRKIDEAQ